MGVGRDDARLLVDGEPRERGRRARRRRGSRRRRSLSGGSRAGKARRHGRLRRVRLRRRGELRRLQPPELSKLSVRTSTGAFVNVGAALVLRRGLEDALLTRSRSSWGGRCPTCWSRRSHPGRCSRGCIAASASCSTTAWLTECRRGYGAAPRRKGCPPCRPGIPRGRRAGEAGARARRSRARLRSAIPPTASHAVAAARASGGAIHAVGGGRGGRRTSGLLAETTGVFRRDRARSLARRAARSGPVCGEVGDEGGIALCRS